MKLPRSATVGLVLAMFLVACSGNPAATEGPGAATTDPGGGPTAAPPATTDPGGGGGGGGVLPGNGSGKVTFEISGPESKSGELPFFGVGSRFGGPAGSSFQFTETDGSATEIFSIYPNPAGAEQWLVSYISEPFQVSATNCEISNWQASDTSASGSFDCQNAIFAKPDGTYLTNARIQGSFEARA